MREDPSEAPAGRPAARVADAVVVGAGAVGASVAYHLARRGCRVTVVDRAAGPGEGSTGRATGGFRAQFASEVNVRLSLLAREKLRRFEEELGVDPGYRPYGYLFLAHSEAALEALAAANDVQRGAGLAEARLVDPDEIAAINPALELSGVAGGSFCPTDGAIRPLEILRGYAEGARRLGVRFLFGSGEVAFDVRGGRIEAVRAGGERVATGAVVNAAGAWASDLARRAGASVPVTPLRRQVAVTRPFAGLPEEMPLTIFLEDGFHLRVRDGRVLLLWPVDHASDDPFDTSFDEAWLEGLLARARARVPCLSGAEVDRAACWSGLYEMSPDKHAILGPSPEVENLYLANGSSGHGVMHAPAIGQLVSEMLLDGRASSLDVSELRPTRFAEGRAMAVSELL